MSLRLTRHGRVLDIELHRPARLNAIDLAMRDALYEAFELVMLDLSIHAVVLHGAGERAFCAGADLTEFGTSPPPLEALRVRRDRDLWRQIATTPAGVVAAIHGHCLGAGLELALLADLRIASRDARFALPEVHLGMIPAAGGTQTLPRAVRGPRAHSLLLTGATIDAAGALRLGLVGKLVPDRDTALAAAHASARHLRRGGGRRAALRRLRDHGPDVLR